MKRQVPENKTITRWLRKTDTALRDARHYLQRAQHGYSDRDAWNANSYLCDVVLGLCYGLRRGASYPSYMESQEEWHAVLLEIEDGFRAAQTIIDDWPVGDQLKTLEKKFKRSMKLLTEHFFTLWD